MKINAAEFETSAPTLAECPPGDRAEFALIGRSNVGKSSLLNLMTQRKGLAKVSATPGRTRLINFFRINGDWRLVDLPGYGFAKVARAQREQFSQSVAEYLAQRDALRCVFVLIDSRHEPQRIDLEFTQWLVECDVPFALVFTKADKIKPAALTRNRNAFLDKISYWCPFVPATFATSTVDRSGVRELLGHIGRLLAEPDSDT